MMGELLAIIQESIIRNKYCQIMYWVILKEKHQDEININEFQLSIL